MEMGVTSWLTCWRKPFRSLSNEANSLAITSNYVLQDWRSLHLLYTEVMAIRCDEVGVVDVCRWAVEDEWKRREG